ncbi:unnamed protein product [Nippostrongylus brasiliensis]|uniref:MATH domain-containing protein n=1 Tax=Nippostrongylus brasiliensis TaxID=27835 RepID=A0A0N4XXT6_NIPBR|nr:unnamed protein product [Nippostrongylus brasiliensis]
MTSFLERQSQETSVTCWTVRHITSTDKKQNNQDNSSDNNDNQQDVQNSIEYGWNHNFKLLGDTAPIAAVFFQAEIGDDTDDSAR